MKWNNLKVSKKIILSFAVPLALMTIIAAWTFLISKGISEKARIIKEEDTPFLILAEVMSKEVIGINQHLSMISATRGLNGLDKGLKAAEKNYLTLLDSMERFKDKYRRENNVGGIRRIDELKSRTDEFYKMGKRMAGAYIKDGAGAGNKLMADFNRAADNLEKILNPFVNDMRGDMEKQLGSIVLSVNKLKTVILVITLFSLLFVMVSGLFLIRSINKPLKETVGMANELAEGELDMELSDVQRKDEFGQLDNAMHQLVVNLRSIVKRIAAASYTVASNSEEVSASVSQIASGIEDQVLQIEQSATASTEISQTIVDVARNASDASSAAKVSVEVANEGQTVVEKAISGLLDISQTVETSAGQIEKLGESNKQIGDIINVINDIADQTNLLALNAAIEAARAGEQGRGFAVVADEVRKLAERTARATEEISEMIGKIQKETDISVQGMEEGKVKAEEGVKLAENAREVLKKIVHASQQSLDMVQSIATATEEQSAAIEQVSTNMENISNVSRISKEGVSQIDLATNDFTKLSGELTTLIAWFKLDDNQTHPTTATAAKTADAPQTTGYEDHEESLTPTPGNGGGYHS